MLMEEVRRGLISNDDTGADACGGTPYPSMETLNALGYRGDFGSAMNDLSGFSLGQHPRGGSQEHSPQSDWAAMSSNDVNVDGGAPFKKRVRYSENFEDDARRSSDEENRAQEGMERAYPPKITRKDASAAPGIQPDIGFYEDLYSNPATSPTTIMALARDPAAERDHPLAETAAGASDEHQDLALMDRLRARGGNEHAAAHHALLDSLTRGHHAPRGASHHYPPAHQAEAHYPPPPHRGTSHAAAWLHNHSYDFLLSQLATAGQEHEEEEVLSQLPPLYPDASTSAVSPPKQKPSLLYGLSYNDIIKGVWKDINQDDAENHYDGGS